MAGLTATGLLPLGLLPTAAAAGGVTLALTGQSTAIAQGTLAGAVTVPVTGQALEVTKATIQFDAASNSGYQTAQTTYSWAHTCTGGLDSHLVVGVSLASSAVFVSNITYDGVALEYLAQEFGAGVGAAAYVIRAPSVGTHNIVVTLDGSCDSIAGGASYTGIQYPYGFEAINSTTTLNTGAADATISSTTTARGSHVIDIVATNDPAITVGAGQTQRVNVAGAALSLGMSSEGPKDPPGSVAMSWTDVGAGKAWSIISMAIRPASGGTLAATIQPAITGQSASVSLGSVAATVAASLTSQSMTIAQGSVMVEGGNVVRALTGQGIPVAQGTIAGAVAYALTGQSVAIAQGSVTPNVAVTASLTGQGVALSQGSVVASVSTAIAGQSIAVATGAVSGSVSAPIAGQGATVSQGAVVGAVASALTGQGAAISLGTIAGGDVVRALTGQGLAVALGSVANAEAATEVILPTTYPGTKKKVRRLHARAVAKSRKAEKSDSDDTESFGARIEAAPKLTQNRLREENSLVAKSNDYRQVEPTSIKEIDATRISALSRARMFEILARAALLSA